MIAAQLTLTILPEPFTIHRLSPESAIPDALYRSHFFSITRSDEELSLVCESTLPIPSSVQEPGWRALQVQGPLDFALTGILARLATTLADADISLFALSTYDTDYLLVRENSLDKAVRALEAAGYGVEDY